MKNLLRSLPILTFFLIASGASQVAQVVKSLPPNCRRQRHGFDPWVREAPLEDEMATLSSLEKLMDRGVGCASYGPCGRKELDLAGKHAC